MGGSAALGYRGACSGQHGLASQHRQQIGTGHDADQALLRDNRCCLHPAISRADGLQALGHDIARGLLAKRRRKQAAQGLAKPARSGKGQSLRALDQIILRYDPEQPLVGSDNRESLEVMLAEQPRDGGQPGFRPDRYDIARHNLPACQACEMAARRLGFGRGKDASEILGPDIRAEIELGQHLLERAGRKAEPSVRPGIGGGMHSRRIRLAEGVVAPCQAVIGNRQQHQQRGVEQHGRDGKGQPDGCPSCASNTVASATAPPGGCMARIAAIAIIAPPTASPTLISAGNPSWSTAIATSAEPIGLFKKSFLALLKMAGVTHSADGRMRTPYSLRHTYATERLNAGVQEYHLAKNMGTSVAMLEKHYGHTSTVGNVRELTKQRRGSGAVVDLEWLAA